MSTATAQRERPVATAERLASVFDPIFYETRTAVGGDLAEAALHYLEHGEAAGHTPHPLFDPAHVRAQLPDRFADSRLGAFEAYLEAAGDGIIIDPHPLFHARHYVRRAGSLGRGQTPLEHYAATVAAGMVPPNPCPLFDSEFCQADDGETYDLIDYVVDAALHRRAPHPLFDPYQFLHACAKGGLRVRSDIDPLTVYLTDHRTWRFPTHTLFDPAVFQRALDEAGLTRPDDVAPLVHFLTLDQDIATCFLFDPAFYRRHAVLKGITLTEPPIVHHARAGGLSGIAPHPLFSPPYYLDKYLDVRRCRMDPLQHFIRHGRFEMRDPHPLISPRGASLAQLDDDTGPGDRFTRYLTMGAKRLCHPHPLFDAVLYAQGHPEFWGEGTTPLEHFVNAWAKRGVVCPPWGTALLERRPREDALDGVDLIVVSHELTRTGAPLILLALVRHFVERLGLRCLVIAQRSGPLLEAFREWAPVIDMTLVAEAGVEQDDFIARCVDAFEGAARPRAALVNTACADAVGVSLARTGLKVITLVHELAAAFDQLVFDNIYQASAAVVFPAEFVKQEAHTRFPLAVERAAVIPQGLLDPRFGQLDRRRARREVLELLDAPDDAFIVFGCGTLDARKGIDLFVSAAMAAITAAEEDAAAAPARPLYFFWAGGGPTQRFSVAWYAAEDIQRSGLGGRIRFVGPRSHTETLFAGSNAFLATSRLDPFPCVVHEAMACGLPVIAFAGAGGAPEALAEDAGIVVPYGDVRAMADAVVRLTTDPAEACAIGARARERVARHYSFVDYGDAIVDVFARRAGVTLRPPSVRPHRARGPRVIFTTSCPHEGTRARGLAALLAGLDARGFDTELIMTRHQPTPTPIMGDNTVKPRLLVTSSRRAAERRVVHERLTTLLEAAAPAIVVPGPDEDAAMFAAGTPRRVGVIGMLDRGDARLEEAALLGVRHWHGAVVMSEIARLHALRINPGWAGYCEVVPPAFRKGPVPRDDEGRGPMRVLCIVGSSAHREVAALINAVADLHCRVTVLGSAADIETIVALFAASVGEGKLMTVVATDDDARWRALCDAEVFVALDVSGHGLLGIDEAMCAGLAVINAAGRASLEPWYRDSDIGAVVARGDIRAVRRALRCLASDPALRLRCRHRAHELAWAHTISLEESLNRYATLFERILVEIQRDQLGFAAARRLFRR